METGGIVAAVHRSGALATGGYRAALEVLACGLLRRCASRNDGSVLSSLLLRPAG